MDKLNQESLVDSTPIESQNRREFLKTSAKFAGAFALSSAFIADSLFATPNSSSAIPQAPKVKLNNGILMPILGLGVLKITDLKECQRVVEDALEVGYRLFDTAQSYTNEAGVGAALKATGVKREEIFITTKLFKDYASEDKVKAAFEQSLKNLHSDYVDLFLIHQPINDTYGAWRAMSKLYKEGLIKAIGVSNFYPDRLVDFIMNNEIKPALNQVECHPFFQQVEAQKQMQELGAQMEAFSPFSQGKNDIFKNAILAQIAKKHNKSIAQVILRWLTQRNIVAIPKTTRKERMIENLSIFDFKLDSKDIAQIATLESGKQLLNHHDPKIIKWLNERKAGSSLK